jgi:polyhydroxyalkanoate synthesis regulator phasin
MKTKFIVLAAAGLSLAFTPCLRADVEAVNKYLGEATELVDKGSMFYEDARGKIELAEASMDDVPAGEKAALKAKIDALKSKIDGAANEQDKKILESKLKRAMDEAEGSIGNLVTWKGAASAVTEILDDPKTTTLLGADAVATAKKQFATFQKLNGGKALKANLEQATTQVEELEKSWAEHKTEMSAADASPNTKESAITDTGRDLEGIERAFTDLPADNSDVKALRARVDKVKADVTAAAGSAMSDEAITRINRFLELYANEFDGMDAEVGAKTVAEYRTKRQLGTAKTEEYVSRVGGFLADADKDETLAATKDVPAVKAKLDELKSKVAAGRAKLKANAEALVAGFEKEKATADLVSDASMLHDQVRNSLGEETPEAKTLMARLDKYEADFKNAGEAADAAKVEYYKKMTEQANKAWPDMMAKFDVTEGFDPNNYKDFKGKYIKITTDNLMGYHFKPGDFPFATTLNGKPVAGKYDPAVAAALAEVEGKIGRGIGDSDDDGKWTVICRVEGTTGTLYQKSDTGGDLTVDGSKVGTWSGTKVDPVESPIVTVVALKAGPVAAAAGQGTVKEDGTVGKSAPPPAGSPLAAASTTSGGRGFSPIPFVMGLFAIVVGAASLMKAKFAPLATNAGAVQLTEKVGGQNIQYIGLAAIALGALGVLMNILALLSAPVAALIGIVASLAMIVAGGVAAREFFDSKKLLPPNIGQLLTQFAVPAGLACAAMGVLTMIVAI